jgi:hypothetical protein
MHSLYFDHAATTRPHASVVACVLETLEDNFANPSSLHRQGLFAERLVEEARVTLAEALFCDEDEIVFTSGGTEANFLALAGTLRTGDTVLTTPLEHASIRVALDYLRETGADFSAYRIQRGHDYRNHALFVYRYFRLSRTHRPNRFSRAQRRVSAPGGRPIPPRIPLFSAGSRHTAPKRQPCGFFGNRQ